MVPENPTDESVKLLLAQMHMLCWMDERERTNEQPLKYWLMVGIYWNDDKERRRGQTFRFQWTPTLVSEFNSRTGVEDSVLY